MKRSLVIAMTSLLLCAPALRAEGEKEEPKFKINPTGRILMDGAAYFGGNGSHTGTDIGGGKFVSGVAIPDVRIGVKASYGNWKAKIDMGFAYAKVNMKDIYIEYDFNPQNLIRVGYFVQQFGYNSCTSSSMKPSMEEATSNEFFYAGPRLLGAMYVRDMPKYLGAVSAFVEGDAIKKNASEMGRQAWGFQTRQVWRPFAETGKMAQVGISANFASPTYNSDEEQNHDSFHFSANFPSRVSKVTDLDAFIDHARGSFKLSPELMLCHGRLALESQYYWLHVYRKDGYKGYTAQGAFGFIRGILHGPDYTYDHAGGGIATPAPKSFEVVAGYNYTNANDSGAGVWGGISNDVSCTFNYYINKYMIARLRYSYTNVRDRHVDELASSRHVNTLQARLQIIF